jgi:hypothetical protein
VRIRLSILAVGGTLALAVLTLPLGAAEPDGERPGREKALARVAAAEAKLTESQQRAVAEFRARNDRRATAVASAPAPGALRKVRAGDDLQQVVVAKRNPDGTITISCVENAGEFAEFLVAGPGQSKPAAKEQ